MAFNFKIVTLERTVYEDAIDQATIPTRDGEITVLARHTPLVSLLKPGMITVKKGGNEYHMAVSSGFIEMRQNNELVILADSAERAEEIDIERAETARERAKTILSEKEKLSDIEYATAIATFEKELVRTKVGRKYRQLNIRT